MGNRILLSKVKIANSPPVASGVSAIGLISGVPETGAQLTTIYSYSSSVPEGVTTFRWLRDGVAIGGAISINYTPVSADVGHLLRPEVTPVNINGLAGTPVQGSDTVSVCACYYVDSAAADDTGAGLSLATAWKTVGKINISSFNQDDRIRLVAATTQKGAGIILPSSGASGHPIILGRTGAGANPILDSTIRYTDWALDSGAIWKRTDNNDTDQVFQDGTRLTYRADKASMDAGSWALAGANLYCWCTDGGNPNTGHTVELASVPLGFTVRLNGKSYITFDGIDCLRGGFIFDKVNTSFVTIQNSVISFSSNRSILVGTDGSNGYTYPTDVSISNVVAHDGLDAHFWVGHCTRVTVQNCESYYCGKDVTPNGKLYPSAKHNPDGFVVSSEAVDCIIRSGYSHDNYLGTDCLDEKSVGGIGVSTRTIWEKMWIDTTLNAVMAFSTEGNDTIFRNSKIYHKAAYAIGSSSNAPSNPSYYNNTVIGIAGAVDSVYLQTGSNIKIKNNIFVRLDGTTGRFVLVYPGARTGFAIDYNDYYQVSGTARWYWDTNTATFATWKTECGGDTHSILTNPVFVNNFTDLNINHATSPCYHTGITGLGVTDDYAGTTRGATPSMGAYE